MTAEQPDYGRSVVSVDFTRRVRLSVPADEGDTLKGGGGDGTSGGMEARVARLEADIDNIKRTVGSLETKVGTMQKDVSNLRVDVATIRTDLKHLPGKGFIVTATSTTFALVTALVLLADKLKAALGL